MAKKKKLFWLTTELNPKFDATNDHNPSSRSGWKAHALIADPAEDLDELKDRCAACGLLPRHGWGSNLFITDPDLMFGPGGTACKRCLRALERKKKAVDDGR